MRICSCFHNAHLRARPLVLRYVSSLARVSGGVPTIGAFDRCANNLARVSGGVPTIGAFDRCANNFAL